MTILRVGLEAVIDLLEEAAVSKVTLPGESEERGSGEDYFFSFLFFLWRH